ncbi:MAG: hypothetical protein U9O94_03205 [Nanoarchaeota archaeon]|nr:hypothetical protein [Nanoarchaeota archaeon]
MEETHIFWIKSLIHLVSIGVIVSFISRTLSLIRQITFSQNYLAHFGLFCVIFLFYNYQVHKLLFEVEKNMRLKQQRIADEQKNILGFLDYKLENAEIDKLKEYIKIFEENRFLEKSMRGYKSRVDKKLKESHKTLKELEYKENIRELRSQKVELKEEIENLREIKKQEEWDKGAEKDKLRGELDIEENKVFLKSELDEIGIEVLEEEGYVQTNEYCVNLQTNVTVFVKPVLKHSKTHTFLVWSAIQLLESFEFVEDIEEHETKDADITFKYANKKYALEIETGTLLKKKKQTKEKVEYLNKKYKDRWLFIVSNKNLVSKYNKLGLATQRKGVEEKLRKLLKIDTQ